MLQYGKLGTIVFDSCASKLRDFLAPDLADQVTAQILEAVAAGVANFSKTTTDQPTEPVPAPTQPVKRGPGRPKGSKNKPKEKKDTKAYSAAQKIRRARERIEDGTATAADKALVKKVDKKAKK